MADAPCPFSEVDGPPLHAQCRLRVGFGDGTVGFLERARAGDLSAYEGLVAEHRDAVYGLALRFTRSEADAAEVTQEVFLRAWRALAELPTEERFGAWVRRVAANQSLSRLRHRKVASQVEVPPQGPEFTERGTLIDEVPDGARDAEGLSLDAELGRAIELASDALPEAHRQVFLLKDVDGLSYEEISEITGESVPAIKSRLHRARLAMRAAIDRFYRDGDNI
ncbi:MAG: RNA polymerase sigma factor [Myxococcaceae bacterium]|nr:RNA polymerase sigma factor [Myxococcaceae bacterium]